MGKACNDQKHLYNLYYNENLFLLRKAPYFFLTLPFIFLLQSEEKNSVILCGTAAWLSGYAWVCSFYFCEWVSQPLLMFSAGKVKFQAGKQWN